MNKFTVIGVTATIILTFLAGITGFFEAAIPYHTKIWVSYSHHILSISMHIFDTVVDRDEGLYLFSIVLMLGICLGIISMFVKRKILFYSSIIIIILGGIAGAAIYAHANPEIAVIGKFADTSLENALYSFVLILSNNLRAAFGPILTGPLIIVPYIGLSIVVSIFDITAGHIFVYGFNGVILWIGGLHIYPELYAIYLAYVTGFRISLKSFNAWISIRRNGVKSTLGTIKKVMVYELRKTALKITILLVIAALLESLWTPLWINYWITHIAHIPLN